jgi:hypothetical protein
LEEDREKIFEKECSFSDIEGFWDPKLKTTHKTATTVHVEEERYNAYQHALIVSFYH